MAVISDTTKPLFDVLFACLVPQLSIRSSANIEQFGSYVTGDKGIDKSLSNQWIQVMIPISRMIEIYQEGAQIRVINEKDTKIIYDYISDHLLQWEGILSNGINIGDAPVEDLIAMDQFANAIYAHAKYHIVRGESGSILGRYISSLGPQKWFLGKAPEDPNKILDKITINELPPSLPERDSMGEFFKNQLMTLRRF